MSTNQPTSYSEAAETLGSRQGRKIAHNTQLLRLDVENGAAVIAVQLHATHVVKFYGSGVIRLDSGGWETFTTKERMNRYLPEGVSVFQKAGVWYVGDLRFGGIVEVPFSDGMLIRPDSVVDRVGMSNTTTPRSLFGDHPLVQITVSKAYRDRRMVRDEATGEWLGRRVDSENWKLYPRDGADYVFIVHNCRVRVTA